MQKIAWIALFGVLFLFGCEQQESLTGIWQVSSSVVGDREIADGKSWFHFKEDGTVDTRSAPGVFRSGSYSVNEDQTKVTLESDGNQITYNYSIIDGTLFMDGILQGGRPLSIKASPVDKVPVTREEEADLVAPAL